MSKKVNDDNLGSEFELKKYFELSSAGGGETVKKNIGGNFGTGEKTEHVSVLFAFWAGPDDFSANLLGSLTLTC